MLKLLAKVVPLKSVAVVTVAMFVGVVASGCNPSYDWLDSGAVFHSGSAGSFGLGCNDQSCDWQNGVYITVTIQHPEAMALLTVGESCINSHTLPGLCMYNSLKGYMTGGFTGIEDNALIDLNCLYDDPPAGFCSSGYGTYGVQRVLRNGQLCLRRLRKCRGVHWVLNQSDDRQL